MSLGLNALSHGTSVYLAQLLLERIEFLLLLFFIIGTSFYPGKNTTNVFISITSMEWGSTFALTSEVLLPRGASLRAS